MKLEVQHQQAQTFLKAIEPNENAIHCFVSVLKDSQGKKLKAKTLYSTFANAQDKLKNLNRKGYEIFVTVNELQLGSTRSNENIKGIRACFVDSDSGDIALFKDKPSMVIQSSRGEHAYWLTRSSNVSLFKTCQNGLIAHYKTDASINDLARCMRVPGFYSHRNKNSPFLVSIKQRNNNIYDLETLTKSYPEDVEAIKRLPHTSGNKSKSNDVLELAHDFIQHSELASGLIYTEGTIFKYMENCYSPVKEQNLRASILQYLQRHYTDKASGAMANNIFQQITAIGYKGSNIQPPCFLSSQQNSEMIIPLENGLLNLAALIENKSDVLIPHTSDYFSLSRLPFRYDLNAKCPKFKKFLQEVLPDKKVRLLIQEWFGYNLIPITRFERMMIFSGTGANGKTVLCTVLRELLGKDSVSSVPLDHFISSRPPYQLAETVGRLANIHEEFSGSRSISSEGILKQFITGSQMTFERKMQQPFMANPAARLTFCTNELPQFRDRSSGLWRRMICIPFEVQIPPNKRKTEFLEGKWWVQTGEMPGVLNWALRGLIRLLERGTFVEPDICVAFKENYKEEVNPTGTFFEEHCYSDKDTRIGTTELYRHYKMFMQDIGQQQLTPAQFAEEVRRRFSSKKTKNAVVYNGGRERVWLGIGYRP